MPPRPHRPAPRTRGGSSALAAAVLVALLAGSPALAQTTANLSGTVFDQTGNPLKGIRVGLESPTQIGGEKVSYSDERGRFRFVQLAPGVFKLTARAPGLKTHVQEGIRLVQNQNLDLDIFLEVDTGETQEIVVLQKAPVIDTSTARVGETFDFEFLDNLPLASRDYQGVATLAPGVVDSTGSGNPSIMGGSFFNNTYTVDGFDTTDPVTHTFGANFSFDAIAAEQVQTAGFGVENSNTTGGVLNIVTKSGSNRFELNSSATYNDQNLNFFLDERDINKTRASMLSLTLGGPIVKDRLWFFAAGQAVNNTLTIPRDTTGQLPDHAPLSILAFDGFIKLTWQVNPRHKLESKSFLSLADFHNLLQSPLVENEAEARQLQRTTFNSLQWHGIVTDDFLTNVGVMFMEEFLDVGPMSCRFDRDCLNVPSQFDVLTGISRGNYSDRSRENRRRWQNFATLTYIKDTRHFGNHQVKLGARWDLASNPLARTVTGDEVLFTFGAERFGRSQYCLNDPRKSDGDCRGGWLLSTVSAHSGLFYLVDQWKPTRYVTITPQLGLHRGISTDDRSRTVYDFWVVTPNIQVAWDATHDGRTKLAAGYAQLVDTGFLALARFAGRRLFSNTCFWDNDVQGYVGNCRVAGGDEAVTVGLPCGPDGLNPDGSSCATRLRPPRTHEFVLSAEREVVTGWVVGLDGVYRRVNHQWDDLETNAIWNQSGTQIRQDGGWKNGRAQFIYDLETPDAARRRWLSFTPILRKREGRLKLQASYTWRRFEGTSNNSFASTFLDIPGQAHFFYGPLPEDIRHNVKIQSNYQVLPYLSVGASYDFYTGGPYNHFFFDQEYRAFMRFKARRGYSWNGTVNPDDDRALRLPDITQFDLQARLNLKPLIGHAVDVWADVLNVLALRTNQAVVQTDGPFFEFPVFRLPPFRVRFGARYRF